MFIVDRVSENHPTLQVGDEVNFFSIFKVYFFRIIHGPTTNIISDVLPTILLLIIQLSQLKQIEIRCIVYGQSIFERTNKFTSIINNNLFVDPVLV